MSDIENSEVPHRPPHLRLLQLLVTVLTVVMILGVVVVVGLLVTRLSDRGPVVPDDIVLPPGETAQAVTFGNGWIAVVTTSEKILIFDALSGALRQEATINDGS